MFCFTGGVNLGIKLKPRVCVQGRTRLVPTTYNVSWRAIDAVAPVVPGDGRSWLRWEGVLRTGLG